MNDDSLAVKLFSPTTFHDAKDWWLIGIGNIAVLVVLGLISKATNSPIINLVYLLVLLVSSWVGIVNTLDRLRDSGRNPWLILVSLIPFGGLYLFYVCGFTASANQ